jgi:hypothetical protein
MSAEASELLSCARITMIGQRDASCTSSSIIIAIASSDHRFNDFNNRW